MKSYIVKAVASELANENKKVMFSEAQYECRKEGARFYILRWP